MRYKAVIFDLFGTLMDNFSRSEYFAVLAQMASILNVPLEEFTRAWRESFPERVNGGHPSLVASIERICHSLGVEVTDEQVQRAARLRLDYTLRNLQPRKDAIETIRGLRKKGYKTALISDCSHETPAVWEKTAFSGVFDTVVFSCTAGIKKPDPRIFRLAAGQLNVRPEDCLYVGDGSSRELTGAQAVGMHPVLIRDPRETVDTHYVEREDDWDGPRISYIPEVTGLLK